MSDPTEPAPVDRPTPSGPGATPGPNPPGPNPPEPNSPGPEAAGSAPDSPAPKAKPRRSPLLTAAMLVGVVAVLAAVGYFGGLGPLSRLSAGRSIDPPAKVGGLDRITDPEIRDQLQLDTTRDALSKLNDGKTATVEAYGDVAGDRMFVVIALRGKVDIDKTVKDSGATPEQIKKVGKSTCVATEDNLPTQCYRGSNTLTVIAQAANDGADVTTVGPVSDEAFDAMK